MRILIAEDDASTVTALRSCLEKNGFKPVKASDGRGALQELSKPDAPRLALIDWMMPWPDGPEVIKRVRSVNDENPPYLIILTSKSGESDIIKGLEAGANDYLVKPFSPGELIARVRAGCRMLQMQSMLIKSREELAYRAVHDSLTGLLNRGAILDVLGKELSRSLRHGDELAVGMCDIDNFKKVNDTFGHQAGDSVLCAVADILRSSVREYDSVGRIGGEEFLIIIPEKRGVLSLNTFERLCALVRDKSIRTKAGIVSVTVSIGAADMSCARTVDGLLAAADKALYRAKEAGRNRVECGRREQ